MELGVSLPHSQQSTICPYPNQINPFLCPSHFWQAQLVSFLVGLTTYQHPGTVYKGWHTRKGKIIFLMNSYICTIIALLHNVYYKKDYLIWGFSLFATVQRDSEAHPSTLTMCTRSLCPGQCVRGVALNPHVSTKLQIYTDTPVPPFCASNSTLLVTFTFNIHMVYKSMVKIKT